MSNNKSLQAPNKNKVLKTPNHAMVLSVMASPLNANVNSRREVVSINGEDLYGNEIKGMLVVQPSDRNPKKQIPLFNSNDIATEADRVPNVWTERFRVLLFGLMDRAITTKSHELVFTAKEFDELLRDIKITNKGDTNITIKRKEAIRSLEAMEGTRLAWEVQDLGNGNFRYLISHILSVSLDIVSRGNEIGEINIFDRKAEVIKVVLGEWYQLALKELETNYPKEEDRYTLTRVSDKLAIGVAFYFKQELKRHTRTLKGKGMYLEYKGYAQDRNKLAEYEQHAGRVKKELIESALIYVEDQGQNLLVGEYPSGITIRDLNPKKPQRVKSRQKQKQHQ